MSVPDDLPDLIERLLVKRAGRGLSLANKAGLLIAGFAKVEELIEAGQAWLLSMQRTPPRTVSGKLDRKFKALVA